MTISHQEKLNRHKKYKKNRYDTDLDYKTSQINKARMRRIKLKEKYLELKSKLICERCGENSCPCLEFHHIARKSGEPSKLYQWSEMKFLTEIKNCIVLCCNCHRKIHENTASHRLTQKILNNRNNNIAIINYYINQYNLKKTKFKIKLINEQI